MLWEPDSPRLYVPSHTADVDTSTSVLYSVLPSTHATPHTRGAWLQIVASTTEDAYGVGVIGGADHHSSGIDTRCLLDIAVGAGGTEDSNIRIPNVDIGNSRRAFHIFFPCFIASGSRVAVAVRGVQVSTTKNLRFGFLRKMPGQIMKPHTHITTMGADTATSRGTLITASGSANTKGAWTEISASTAERFRALCVSFGLGGDTNISAVGNFLDIGVGASSNERLIAENIPYTTDTQESIERFVCGPYEAVLPAGSRLVARYASSSPSITPVYVALHGIKI